MKLLRAVLFALITLAILATAVVSFAYAAEAEEGGGAGFGEMGKLLGAGMAIGFAGLGAGVGMGTASAAAIGAMAEKPEVFGRTLIYIVFIEAIAIYGLVISFMLIMM